MCAKEYARRDDNYVPVGMGVTDDSDLDTTQIRVDSASKRLLVDSASESQGHGALGDGSVTLATANATAQVSADITCKRAFIQAHQGNKGVICVGGGNVAATLSLRTGLCLHPTQGAWFYVSNLNLTHVIADTALSTITYYYEN